MQDAIHKGVQSQRTAPPGLTPDTDGSPAGRVFGLSVPLSLNPVPLHIHHLPMVPSASTLGHSLLPYTVSISGELGHGAVTGERCLGCQVDADAAGRQGGGLRNCWACSAPAPPASLGLPAAPCEGGGRGGPSREMLPACSLPAPPCLLSASLPPFLSSSLFLSLFYVNIIT